MEIKIRKATTQDLPSVFEMVKALALYEKAPEEVKTTLQDYINDFETEIYDVLVADKDGEVIGIALYFLTFSTWKGRMMFLEDFVVKDEYRGIGIGKFLFDSLIEQAQALGCKLMKWQVLDWNEPAINFYNKYGATYEKEWWNCKINV